MKRMFKMFTAYLLTISLIMLPMVSPVVGAVPAFDDVRGHWAEYNINNWLRIGLAGGNADGNFSPDAIVNRAEFISFLNRAFGYTAETDISFSDVSAADWFYPEVTRAIKAGYVSDFTDGTFRPYAPVSRIDAAEMLYKAIKLNLVDFEDVLGGYSDSHLMTEEQGVAANALVSKSLMVGSQGKFSPLATITRAETIAILDRAAGEIFNQAGTYGPATGQVVIRCNVTVSVTDVTLSNTLIEGDLYLTEGIKDGEVTLHNVVVKGRTIVAGGGPNSIDVTGTSALAHVIIIDPNGVVSVVFRSEERRVWK